jgi:deoxyribodipyrimidine photo-lyase
MAKNAMLWLRNDLRLADNPALIAALAAGGALTAIYINETDETLRPIGQASRWWLHHSLNALAADLATHGIPLKVCTGPSLQLVPELVRKHAAEAIFWNRRYSPAQREHDAELKRNLVAQGIEAQSSAALVLAEPFELQTRLGQPFSVFTPFWQALKARDIPAPLPVPNPRLPAIEPLPVDTRYKPPAWSEKLAPFWSIGEGAANARLADFLDTQLAGYAEDRNVPGRDITSTLSPHLHFGEIGPRQVWHAAAALAHRAPDMANAVDKFLSELAWRDFAYHLLYHHDDIANMPMQAKFAKMPWRYDPASLAAWEAGRTGYPIIDAGMRQLWQTGWMHNRIRMLVASFLAKNLLLNWRLGEQWFWDTLVDADEANNPASWQWVAGSGTDAAPYFRIFNPVIQGERFDPDGSYVRRWVPELANLPDEWLQEPFAAPGKALKAAGVTLGETYPHPIVDLKTSRQRALDALSELS